MSDGGPLGLVLSALKTMSGYFVWKDADGEEYVIVARRDFEARMRGPREEQLDLLRGAGAAASPLDNINRDLALYQLQREEEEGVEGSLPLPPKADLPAGSAGKKVRFEPLRGDLPPELQE